MANCSIPTVNSQTVIKIKKNSETPHTYTVKSFTDPETTYTVKYWRTTPEHQSHTDYYGTFHKQNWSCTCKQADNKCKHICIASRFQTETWEWLGLKTRGSNSSISSMENYIRGMVKVVTTSSTSSENIVHNSRPLFKKFCKNEDL